MVVIMVWKRIKGQYVCCFGSTHYLWGVKKQETIHTTKIARRASRELHKIEKMYTWGTMITGRLSVTHVNTHTHTHSYSLSLS